MERSLITGSHGFIGQALSRELTNQGQQVLSVPRDWCYLPKVDYIYHLAAYGNMASQQDAQEIFQANVVGLFDLLEESKSMDYKKLVFVSTSSVLLPTQTLYSATKSAAEALITAYDKPISIIRPYSVTGVGEQAEHLIPKLIEAAFTGKTIPFVPEPTHDYIDVEDVAKALINIAKKPTNTTYHLGSGIGRSNQRVKEIIEEVTGRQIAVEVVDNMRSYDVARWKSPDGKWAKKTFRTIIEEMVEAYGI